MGAFRVSRGAIAGQPFAPATWPDYSAASRGAQRLNAFFINLDRHADRRAHIEGQLHNAGLSAERVAGVNGREVPPDLAGYFDLDSTSRYALTAGQIGCQASHLRVMRLITEMSLDVALVLEDDALLAEDVGEILAETLQKVPAGWDIVRLCRSSTRAVRPLATLSCGRSLVRYSRVPVGRAGYLVSRSGAAKLLRPRKMYIPGDDEISQSWLLGLDVYGIEPNPISQERSALPTTIGVKRGGLNRFKRAIPNPRRLAFHVSKLGPNWWTQCFVQNVATKVVRWMGRVRHAWPDRRPAIVAKSSAAMDAGAHAGHSPGERV
jgi:glycosyl transferase family 25